MIVPENEPVQKYSRIRVLDSLNNENYLRNINMVLNWPDAHSYGVRDYAPIGAMFMWDTTPQGHGYWAKLADDARAFNTAFVLPDEARSYLEWLIKDESKDNFEDRA